MNLDLRSLKHVIVVSRLLSFTKAAQELHITQSALSRSIQTVEKHAGVKLFDRDRGGVHVTAVGRDFVTRAAALLRDAEDLDHSLRRSAKAEVGEVAFGIGPLAGQALLPGLLHETFASKPELRTRVLVRNIDAWLPALIKEEIEFVVTAESAVMQSMPLESEFLGWFPISLIVRAGHPLLGNPQGLHSSNFPLISPGQFTNIESWPSQLRRHLGGPLHIIEDCGVAARITELSDAIWLSSAFAATFEIRAGKLLELVPSRGRKSFRFRMMAYHLGRRSLSPAAVLIRDSFRRQLSALAQT